MSSEWLLLWRVIFFAFTVNFYIVLSQTILCNSYILIHIDAHTWLFVLGYKELLKAVSLKYINAINTSGIANIENAFRMRRDTKRNPVR